MARVDVVMPVRNGMPFVEAAIRSIMDQTVSDWRLRVLDHASTDGTSELVDRLAAQDARISRISFDASLTVSQVRNRGFDLCDAPYVMLHDADDLSLPERMAVQVAYLDDHPQLAIAGSGYVVIDEDDRVMGARALPSDPARISVACLFSNPIAHPSVMVRPSILNAVNGRYGQSFMADALGIAPLEVPTLAEDYLLFGQLATLGLCGNAPANLIRYRRHSASVGISNFEKQMLLSADVSRHLMHIVTARHGLEWQDPTPFCNHGARVLPIPEATDGRHIWSSLKETVEKIFGRSDGVVRELDFRATMADRRLVPMALAFSRFLLRHRADGDELPTMRHLLKKQLRR